MKKFGLNKQMFDKKRIIKTFSGSIKQIKEHFKIHNTKKGLSCKTCTKIIFIIFEFMHVKEKKIWKELRRGSNHITEKWEEMKSS